LNLVSADPAASIAFYRRLGIDISDAAICRTPSGVHHVNARSGEVGSNWTARRLRRSGTRIGMAVTI